MDIMIYPTIGLPWDAAKNLICQNPVRTIASGYRDIWESIGTWIFPTLVPGITSAVAI